MEYYINVIWDDEASVWVATSEDIRKGGTNLLIKFSYFLFKQIPINLILISNARFIWKNSRG